MGLASRRPTSETQNQTGFGWRKRKPWEEKKQMDQAVELYWEVVFDQVPYSPLILRVFRGLFRVLITANSLSSGQTQLMNI